MSSIKYMNPLAEGRNRNKLCPCYSQIKVKKCHGKDRIIDFEKFQEIQKILRNFFDNVKIEAEKLVNSGQ